MLITAQILTRPAPAAFASATSSITFRRCKAWVSLPLLPKRRPPIFLQHQQGRHLRHGLLLALQLLSLLRRTLRLEGSDLLLVLLVALLQVLLVAHGKHLIGIGILSGLAPTVYLLWVQAPLAAAGAELSGVKTGALQHHRELVGSAPGFWGLL